MLLVLVLMKVLRAWQRPGKSAVDTVGGCPGGPGDRKILTLYWRGLGIRIFNIMSWTITVEQPHTRSILGYGQPGRLCSAFS